MRTMTIAVLLLLQGCLAGCQLGDVFPADMQRVLAATTQKVADQGVLKDWSSNADVNVEDPGIESYVEIRLSSGVRLRDVNGEIDLRAQGDSTRLPNGVRDELIKSLPTVGPDERNRIIELLGWNRTGAGGNPNAASPKDFP